MKPNKRKSATTPRRAESAANTPSGSTRSDDADKPLVREFIYLDYPKLASYYAQLHDGWRTSAQHIASGAHSDVSQAPITRTGFEGAFKATAGEDISVARLIGLVADLNLKFTRFVEHGGEAVGRTQAETIVETTELHHALFERVERRLVDSNLIETSLNRKASKRPFYRVRGSAEFLVLDDFIRYVNENQELSEAMKDLGHDGLGAIDKSEPLEYVLKRFYTGELGAIVSADGGAVSAALDPKHLLTPIDHIVASYGRRTQIPITILGIRAVRLDAESLRKATTGTYVNEMTRALISVNDGLRGMDDTYRLRADVHLFPIAVYVDLVPPEGQMQSRAE